VLGRYNPVTRFYKAQAGPGVCGPQMAIDGNRVNRFDTFSETSGKREISARLFIEHLKIYARIEVLGEIPRHGQTNNGAFPTEFLHPIGHSHQHVLGTANRQSFDYENYAFIF